LTCGARLHGAAVGIFYTLSQQAPDDPRLLVRQTGGADLAFNKIKQLTSCVEFWRELCLVRKALQKFALFWLLSDK
jgi:hypothetical protein